MAPGTASVYYGGAVYYHRMVNATTNHMMRVSPSGGSPAVVASDSIADDNYRSITATQNRLYWVSGSLNGIASIAAPTGVGTSAPDLFWAESGVRALASDVDTVYWVTANTLERCPARACDDASRRVLVSAALDFSAVAVDAEAIYWVSGIATDPNTGNVMQGSVWKIAK
jgi:hypothetical protein